MRLRKLNEQGIRNFREFLSEARMNGLGRPSVPTMLLTLPLTSEEIKGAPELELFSFSQFTRYELACYLNTQLANIDPVIIEGVEGLGDPGFWSAMSLFYFHYLVPGYMSGERPEVENRYIPETSNNIQLGNLY